jgi:hypothetical protein
MRMVGEEVVDDTLWLADDVSALAVFVVVDQQWESFVKTKSREMLTRMKRACDRSKRKANAVVLACEIRAERREGLTSRSTVQFST